MSLLHEKLLRRVLVAAALHENIEYVTILIDGPPEIMPCAVDREKDLIQVPLVARLGAPATELIGIRLPELLAPLPDRFVGDDDSTSEQQLFDIAIAEAEAEVEPDAVADDLGREAVVFVPVDWGGSVHRNLRTVDRYQENASPLTRSSG
jgi:hypothetical protein